MRQFIRHPSSMPVRLRPMGDVPMRRDRLEDISAGGLRIQSTVALEPGCSVLLGIEVVDYSFEGEAVVVWCRRCRDGYSIGVRFVDNEDGFRARMIEQVCHIERYRRRVAREEGRQLSSEEAASEWVGLFAADFPTLQ